MTYATIELERRDAVTWLWMNRPEVHNAFDESLICKMTDALQAVEADASVRVLVLAGRGKSFSAGADLSCMRRQSTAQPHENLTDARALAALISRLAQLRKPTIARVHDAALGGGMGLAAACDICIASTRAIGERIDAEHATTRSGS